MFEYSNIPQMLYGIINNNPSKKIFHFKSDNKWESINGSDIIKTVESIACGLKSLGINKNDKVAILSSTSYIWALCDYGIICNSSTTVTIYPTLIKRQVEFILNNSESKVIFVENKEQSDKILSIIKECNFIIKIIVMDDSGDYDNNLIINYSDMIDIGSNYIINNNIHIENEINLITGDDLLTLIYTSGTTVNL